MRDRLTAKMLRLRAEAEAARSLGPGSVLGKDAPWAGDNIIRMYDASRLARELAPEVQLHYSVVAANGGRLHTLEYIVLPEPGVFFRATMQSIYDWLDHCSEHVGGTKVEEAFHVIDAAISGVDPGQKRVLLKALGTLSKALMRR